MKKIIVTVTVLFAACVVVEIYNRGNNNPKSPSENPSPVSTATNDGDAAVTKKILETCVSVNELNKKCPGSAILTIKEEWTVPKGFVKKLPPKPESRRATEARRLWEGLKREQDFLHGCVLQNRVQFGPNNGTTAKSERSEYEAALVTKQAWKEYHAILKEEQ